MAKVAGGFVGEHQFRTICQSASHGRSLLLAGRELAWIIMQTVAQPHLFQQGFGKLALQRLETSTAPLTAGASSSLLLAASSQSRFTPKPNK